ncbi:hypothetical protein AA13595_2295 [Gluconacetobacter johannae DSM 13595]|uniref:Uncharacterized protein n=1 Tax=Gluconacetobacter johannae TaxID=112140 RepID=A0A7W4P4F2_9PROT|nr:hypothetical protein [Gluconacetobacter johannae]MBB2174973.1 hypothetical protein [Gluconacetobacter johannae]GBQ88010.1 hypothetical protein AA13595_2295 [Gluconacetobacter johannae DSM 13595]
MRAFHGQMSDNQPIRRSQAEKQKQLRDLRETLAAMKSHTAPTLRESVQKRIRQLEAELAAAPALKSTDAPRGQRTDGPRQGPGSRQESGSPRRHRSI